MSKWTEYSLMLQPSPIGGIGVFAMQELEVGVQVFRGDFSPRTAKIKDIPAGFLKYCIFLNDTECLCPERFDRMEIGWFLNHSEQPNIKRVRENYIIVVRPIKIGDEVLIDYNDLNEPEHLKEPYFSKAKS